MESVRKFVDDFHALEKPLHVLINNAGVTMSPKDPKRQYTSDGFEMTIGTNHFGRHWFSKLYLLICTVLKLKFLQQKGTKD